MLIDKQQIIDDLLTRLRNVGCSYAQVELSHKTIADVEHTKSLYRLIKQHDIPFESEVQKLSKQCNWDLLLLLKDILDYPNTLPRVKRLDGTLHYQFKNRPEPLPIDKKIIDSLREIAIKQYNEELKRELLSELKNGQPNILFITATLAAKGILTDKERAYVGNIFMQFY